MWVKPRERLVFQDTLKDSRAINRPLFLLVPTLTDVSFDEETQSGRDVSSGTGLGQIASWGVYKLFTRFVIVDQTLVTYGHVPPGVNIGNVLASIGKRDFLVFSGAIGNEHHYAYIDGETYRIQSINPVGIGNIEEYSVAFVKYTPKFRNTGY
jgi:hypothetical protein